MDALITEVDASMKCKSGDQACEAKRVSMTAYETQIIITPSMFNAYAF